MRREDYRATLIVMLGLGAATLTGFVREAALAYQFGAGRATDIYLVAYTIPEFLFVALPIVLSATLIPFFADLRLRAGEAPAWRFGRRVAAALLALLLGAALLIGLTAPLFLRWLAPGFSPAERDQALRAVYVMLPALCLLGTAALFGAALQVYRRFARPALATAVYNLTFVAVLLAAPLVWPVGRAAWGVTIGALAALLVQGSLLRRFRPPASDFQRLGSRALATVEDAQSPQPWAPSLGDVARLAGPLAAGYAIHHAIYFVDRAMATTVAVGSVATLNYAYRLALTVGQVSGLAVSTAVFPRMAEQVAGDDLPGLRAGLAHALRFVWMVGLPATLGLILLRTPLVRVLFQRGAFDQAATEAVSGVLVWYALAVLSDALCQPFWRVLYARRNAKAILAVNSLQTAVRVVCNFALISTLGYNGLALSAALGLSLQLVVLGCLAWRQVGSYLNRRWWLSAIRIALAATVAVTVTGLVLGRLPAMSAVAVLLLGGTLGALLYLGNLYLAVRLTS